MWRLAFAAAPVLVLALVLAGGVASQTDTPTPSPEATESESPSPSPSPSPEASPTPEVLPPPPPATPFDPNPPEPAPPWSNPGYTGSLRAGDWVQITGTDSCLNMRYQPQMPVPGQDGIARDNVLNCLPDGFIGKLDAFGMAYQSPAPVFADGRWWWHIVGQGWAAEEFLTFHHQGGMPWPPRPELASAGLIAYIATDNSIWLMGADGSNQRPIVGSPGQGAYIQSLRWSPRGDMLSYTLRRWDVSPSMITTQVIDLNGAVIAEYPGLAEALWSPGGGRFSALRVNQDGDLGGYYAAPVVLDLDTRAEVPVGPVMSGYSAPAWSPDGNSLAFVCISNYNVQPDGSVVVDPERSCGGDGLRIAAADGSGSRVILPMNPTTGPYFSNPSWSRGGGTIAVYSIQQDGGGCRGYAFVDVATGAVGGCASLPAQALFIGGRCGGGTEMGASTWTADGRLIFSAQGAGESGVFVHIPATGARTVVPNMNAEPASLSPTGVDLTFGGGGHIWVAGLDGSNLTLVAEGHSPAWQPQP
jgi:Tol biopolymer transport system component